MNDRALGRVRDSAVLYPLTVPNALLWLALTGLAYAGNAANLALSANLNFQFGSIPILAMLHFFGWVPSLVAVVISSLHTVVLWGHAYGVLVLTAELLFVGMLYRHRSNNLLLLDTVFWVLIGIPVLILVERGPLDGAATESVVVALRMAVNGIFNALIASLATTLLENVLPRVRHAPARRTLGFAQTVFLVMIAFVLIPAMVILVFTTRQEMVQLDEDVRSKLEITAFSAHQAVNAWMTENFQTLRSLASFAGKSDPKDVERLRNEMSLLNMSDADFRLLAVTDTQGRLVLSAPGGEENRSLRGSALASRPRLARMMTDLQGVVSDAVFPTDPTADPFVVFGVPVVAGDQVTGAAIGVLDTLRLQDLLARVSGNWSVDVTVVDGNDVVIASTDRAAASFSDFSSVFPGPYDILPSGLAIRTEGGSPDMPLSRRWHSSEYSVRERLGVTSSWTIGLHAAIAPYQDSLNERYRSVFSVMIIVIIFTTLLSAYVSRKMLGSVTQLAAVAEDLPDKVIRQEDPRWPLSRIDEIHTLIQSFRITSEHLARSFTQLQKANAELTTANEQAELANRTKSEFLANISHDLRTPLNGILGYAQILARDTSLDDQTRNAVDIIRKSGNHLLNLINDILDVSRIEADKLNLRRDPFFLGSFLDDIADIVSLQARHKGLQLIVDFAADLPQVVLGDEKRLRQILLNLLNNAVKFTDKGSVRFSGRAENGRFIVEVEDTGIGIPEDELESIFSPFKQLTKHIQTEEGTGLGLAIVKRLASMMDGDVTVRSTPDTGSVFTLRVTLPVTDMVPSGPQSVSTITGYSGPVRTVLVVDDKEQNRSVLRGMLEPLGFVLCEAADGLSGIELMSREKPDIVLMDLVMPNMDGFEAIREIRSSDEIGRTVVVAVSASVASTIRDECIRLGFSDFIPKPFRETEMLAIVGRHLGLEWVHTREAVNGDSDPVADVTPSSRELDPLAEQVESGNIRGIVSAADDLAGRSESYRAFARSVTDMAQAFQIDRLAEFLREAREKRKPGRD